jgi:ABC-type multidrug transport system ATPase subunit
MPEGSLLEFSGVTKRFGAITAVSDFSARVESGRVTGFLGPNGAGKTTSLRILLGLVRATSGTATIGGVPYAKLDHPLQTVGAVLEASSFHPGRTAANHLAVYAAAAGIPRSRIDDVLGLVGLADAAGRKVGGFSLGMRQRLGLAYALLGDPGILVLDEPANGLDPEGIKWMRGFLRQLAREGRTVLTSSHLLAEVQQTVDSLLVISHGRLVFAGGLDELTDPSEYATVVDAPDRKALADALTAGGVTFEVLRSGLTVRGLEPVEVGAIAASAGVALSSLQRRGPALEEVFLELVDGTRVHPGSLGPAAIAAAPEAVAAEAVEEPETPAETVVDEPVETPRDEGATVAAVGAAAVVGTAAAQSEDGEGHEEPMDAEPAEVAAATEGEAPATAAFVVASTGVIDVVGAEERATDAAPAVPEADPEADPEAAEVPEAVPDATDADPEVAEVTDAAPEVAESTDAAPEAAEAAHTDDDAPSSDGEESPAEAAETPESAPESDGAWQQEPEPEANAAWQPESNEGWQPEPQPESQPEADVAWHSEPEWEAADEWREQPGADAQADEVNEAQPEEASDIEQTVSNETPPSDAEAEGDPAPVPDLDGESPLGPDDDLVDGAPSESSDSERPWEDYVKTDSDVEADAFFASFDAEHAAALAAEATTPPAGEPTPDGEPEAVGEGTAEPYPGRDPEPQPDPDPGPPSEEAPEAEASIDEVSDETSEFGALSDLSPDWVEEDQNGHRDNGGEQR